MIGIVYSDEGEANDMIKAIVKKKSELGKLYIIPFFIQFACFVRILYYTLGDRSVVCGLDYTALVNPSNTQLRLSEFIPTIPTDRMTLDDGLTVQPR